ncbi:MAG: YIP1 family protein [Terrimicrobiaceae bacterium]
MNRIHIARNRQSLGQFSPEEVAQGLASGELLATDLAWREPMESWKPLSEFTDLPEALPSLTPPALPQVVAKPEVQPEPAWERRAQLGTLPALVQTVRQVLSVPVATFKAMKREGGLGAPLFFYVIVTAPTTWVAMGYYLAAVLMNPEAMLEPFAKQFSMASLIGIEIFSMALVPVLMAGVAFGAAGIFHVVFQLLGGGGQRFEVTFRAYCYAVAPASVFKLIPICGDPLFFVTAIVLLIFSLRETLQVDGVRATVGVVLPSLLCCGFFWAWVVLVQGLAQGMVK